MAKGLFDIPDRPNKAQDLSVAKKSSTVKKSPSTSKSGGGLLDRISRARSIVENNLGEWKNQFEIIRDEQALKDFVKEAVEFGCVAIDTETTGLDPLQDELVGISLTSANRNVYVPVNHKSYIDRSKVENQLDESLVGVYLAQFNTFNTFVVMFHASFDIRFIWNHTGTRLHCNWDCQLAARLMNENEGPGNNNLKALHHKYCPENEKEALRFSDIFEGISFDLVPINLGYIYAANDSRITMRLYEFQKQYVYYDPTCEKEDRNGMNGVSWVFFNIEMPCVDAIVDMENTGVAFDLAYNEKLHEEYHKKLDNAIKDVYKTLQTYEKDIHNYRLKNTNNKLDDPINLGSPTQIAILLYDIMQVGTIDANSPRGTGEKILAKINNDFTKALLSYRALTKLVDTYIDKLPKCVNPNDGRIHCKFNQYGADTGRMSSSEPNLQNIPSHNKDIRKMFVASPGYVLLSSDYSQQEPSCLASLCNEMGYPALYNARVEGDDIYSHVASACFNVPYEQCCEFDSKGHKNPPEYKERRNMAKPVLLGILYGRGDDSVAEGMGISIEEAKKLKANLYKKYPEIKKFEDSSIQHAEDFGYVTTVCGRKRRLPSMMLPDYEIKWKDGVAPDDDPLAFDTELSTEVPEDVERKWLTRVTRARFKDKRKVFEDANKEGIWIVDHTREKDVTKVVNASIQGSAADLTKLALIDLRNDEKLKELGFRLLIPVHDEVIGECPEENVKECARLLAEVMSNAAQKILGMPFNCDVEISREWYGKTLEFEEEGD